MLVDEQGTNNRGSLERSALGAALAGYPHVTGCAACRDYLAGHVDPDGGRTLVAAVLGYHDSCHRHDPLQLLQRF